MKSLLLLSALILAGFQNVTFDIASISGTVTEARSNKPLSGVRIHIDGIPLATTGPDGRFAIGNILPGRHEISITLRGYLTAGRTGEDAGSVLRPPSNVLGTVDLKPGQIVQDMHVEMVREGLIGGKVMLEDGSPVTGAEVLLFQVSYMQGKRRIVPFNPQKTITDYQGRYNIWGMPAGEYYLRATYRTRTAVLSGLYPSELEPSTARPLVLSAGGEFPNAHITLPSIPASSTTITIVPPEGSKNLTGALYIAAPRGTDPAVQVSAAIGLAPLPWMPGSLTGQPLQITVPRPGSYDLFLAARSDEGVYLGQTSIATTSGNSLLTLGNLYDVLVKVTMDRIYAVAKAAPVALQPVSAFQYYASTYTSPNPSDAASPLSGSEGTFKLSKIAEGDYTIVPTPPPSFYVADVRRGGKSVVETPIRIDSVTQEPIETILRSNGGTITGVLKNPALQGLGFHKVALVPNAPHRSAYVWYKTTMTDFGGRFEFADVAPGAYKIFAWMSAPDGAWTSAEYLKKFEDRGTPVAVKEGQHLMDLTVSLIQ